MRIISRSFANNWRCKYLEVCGDLMLAGIFKGVFQKVMNHGKPYVSEEVFVTHLSLKDVVPIG